MATSAPSEADDGGPANPSLYSGPRKTPPCAGSPSRPTARLIGSYTFGAIWEIPAERCGRSSGVITGTDHRGTGLPHGFHASPCTSGHEPLAFSAMRPTTWETEGVSGRTTDAAPSKTGTAAVSADHQRLAETKEDKSKPRCAWICWYRCPSASRSFRGFNSQSNRARPLRKV